MTKAHNCSVASLASRMSVTVSRCFGDGQRQCAQRAERPGLRGRGDPDEDGAQHQQDQRQWRHQGEDHPLRQIRDQPGKQMPPRQRDHHRRTGADGAAMDEGRARHMRREKMRRQPGDAGAERDRRDQRTDSGQRHARLRRQGGHHLRAHQADEKDVERERAGQGQGRDQGSGIHVADRAPELVGQHDQHQRGRHDLRQRARSRDHPGREALVVMVAQHDRQGNQPHRDHRRGDHARGRGQKRADEHHRIGEPAACRAKKLRCRIQQIFRHARALQHQPHEGEEGDGQKRLVGQNAEDPLRQGLQETRSEQAEMDPQRRIGQSERGQ